ncbi:hypothetical protein TK11N_14950 [Tetragenococcus koreensis]|uniref:Uncharacterized protein n=1 Tax=Tetragenococcus koreensis TaxID=290335 RepID=A0AAN4UC00_9ENTE|nr:hypothetical protein TK11N_14950 [Tetragenococcus koreensis]GEQ52089.1 hypothetical protein TK12N_14330 [Tetragenococcus koreensis]GEQ54624.1 hypothetical protein TK2N_14680 [Tetragenococcus koreensis]GEQ57096.1 hypothetical protein TK4N_14390 [Tetragenococcus koreensis]GEQ59656.1 hypothetical protein TK6N_14950 [Tetragenococcus koreensis]
MSKNKEYLCYCLVDCSITIMGQEKNVKKNESLFVTNVFSATTLKIQTLKVKNVPKAIVTCIQK